MITLDQVQKLETKVNDAVDLINRLKAEKVVLEEKLVQYEMKILELEEMAETLNKDQNEIEDKIIGALNQLEDIDATEQETTQVVVDESEEANEPVESSQHFEESAPSAEGSVSEDQEFVITESVESDEEVTNSEINSEEDTSEVERDDDNQSELQEIITEDSQDGLPADETVEEDIIPTVESEFGEMPENNKEKKEENGPAADLFEQSLDIF